jgi:hypothetical protein
MSSLMFSYVEPVEQSIDVDLMDVKNIANMILGYADYSYSQKFLVKFFNFFNHIIENCVYLNKEKTEWFFVNKIEEVSRDFFEGRKFKSFFKAVSVDEKEMVEFLKKSTRANSDIKALFNLKINKKTAIGMAGFKHNTDRRSVNAKEYLIKSNEQKDATISCAFNFEEKKYVKYFPEGFTLKEYVSEYLQIRGNPYDRWFTMYNEATIPSEKDLEKVNKIINNEVKITSENCILFDFDFGS